MPQRQLLNFPKSTVQGVCWQKIMRQQDPDLMLSIKNTTS